MAIPWSHDSTRLLRRPLPLPTPAPQIRLVFVRRTQCEKMSPRGRAPWPPALTTGALNHSASFLPSLPPQQLVELGEGVAVRAGGGSRYHLLALNCLPALAPPPSPVFNWFFSQWPSKIGQGFCTRELRRYCQSEAPERAASENRTRALKSGITKEKASPKGAVARTDVSLPSSHWVQAGLPKMTFRLRAP